MTLRKSTRRARLLVVRDDILAAGGGALHIHDGTIVATPEEAPASAPLVIVVLDAAAFDVHPTEPIFTVAAQGFVAVSGQPTWCRFVDGAGNAVLIRTAGLPGSGAQVIVTDGKVPAGSALYVGGECNVSGTFSD
jgi:hypothetical protein